jgi:Holliday junction resolvase
MRRAARVDANQRELVRLAQAAGCSVQSLAQVGKGCPDLLLGRRGSNLLVEVKDGSKPASQRKLRESQETWRAGWRGQVTTIETPQELVDLLNEEN